MSEAGIFTVGCVIFFVAVAGAVLYGGALLRGRMDATTPLKDASARQKTLAVSDVPEI